jgi:BASS family bile acid:Na+ symporter
MINWSFFVVIYTIVGLNQGAFLEHPLSLMPSLLIAFVSTFVLGFIVNHLARFWGVSKTSRISLILLVTRKNYGMAAAIALVLFGARAAVPAAVTTVFAIVHFIWLSFRVRKMD